jgi:hypothetical protein
VQDETLVGASALLAYYAPTGNWAGAAGELALKFLFVDRTRIESNPLRR